MSKLRFLATVAFFVILCCGLYCTCCDDSGICPVSVANAQVYRPARPNPTAQPDAPRGLGVPRPATPPNCAAGSVILYADSADNLYACVGASRVVLKASGAGAASFPTATVSPTPTVTVTATPTATKTATPTPTVTSTP